MRSCILMLLCWAPYLGHTQCTAAPIAAAACSGGNGAATNGVNINSGNTYWFSGGPSTFTGGVNLSGGTLRVCGTLTLSSINYNSGTIIVESGGNLTINNAGISASGATIINRGTLTINGNITLQGSNNAVYNDLSTSVLTISGTLTLNGSTTYLINRGLITINTLLIQSMAGSVCMQDNAILNLTQLDNNVTNSISYSGAGAPACVNVSTTAVLNNDVASSAKIYVCTNATPSGGAAPDASHGWGLAKVTTGCSSCATVLAAEDITLSASMGNEIVQLQWTSTGDHSPGDIFVIERSVDGAHFSALGSQEAVVGSTNYTATDADISGTKQYYRIRLVSAGVSRYSPIVEVETGYNQAFSVYPNPTASGAVLTIVFSSPAAGSTEMTLISVAGQAIVTKRVAVTQGSNRITWQPGEVAAGVYFIRVVTPAAGCLYRRLVITR